MNMLLKKAAAVITAGLMTVSCLGAESFAESGKLVRSNVSLALDAAVSKPTYQVKGTAGVRRIALSTTTAGATIYYTTNGSTPTTKSKKYTGSLLKTTKDVKIKAIAVKGGVSSAVMTKTFKVATLLGDVTGDGNINQNDYIKLKNYLAGKTTYICKDNADCNGSGGLSSKDLTVLEQYLAAKIAKLPSDPISVSKPKLSASKTLGGKLITITSPTSGATLYYTDDGSEPTTSSKRYTSSFLIDSSKTIRVIAYKDGTSSKAAKFIIEVGTLGAVQADKSTATTYNAETPVTLTSSGATTIIYTTDGSDPKTSNTASAYYSPIKLTKDTTIKAYARAKGYADTAVATFSYKVNAAFKISGTVWDDTTGTSTVANGVKATTENGISGIVVYLIKSTTAVKDAPLYYVQRQITDAYGKYTFSGIAQDTYKVVFEYNYMKYRAYNAIVTSGNQALAYETLNPVTVKANGTYTTVNYADTYLNSVIKYSDAIANSTYTTYAVTSSSYSASAENVDFALISKNYGAIEVAMSVKGQSTSDNTVKYGDKLTYTVTVKNNTAMTALALANCEIGVYIPVLSGVTVETSSSGIVPDHTFYDTDSRNYPGYYYITVRQKTLTNIAAGKSFDFTVSGYVTADVGTKLNAYAFVNSYKYSIPCYDYSSTPGNFTIGYIKEKDEAAATTITVSESSASGKSIYAVTDSTTVNVGETSTSIMIVAEGCTSKNDIIFGSETTQGLVIFTPTYKVLNGNLYISLEVYGLKAGRTEIPVYLANNTSKYTTVYVTVK